MNTNANTRAIQHLLVQGFTPYTCPAAVCTRLGAPIVLETHPWAIIFESSGSAEWAARLLEDDPLRAHMVGAAQGASLATPKVLCHWDGVYLALPLAVDEVRHARARLEVAKNLGVEPTSLEGLAAVPEDVLRLELKRRKRQDSGEKEGQSI